MTLRKHLSRKLLLSIAGASLAALPCAAFAAVPSVVVDSQFQMASGLNSPQSIAVAPNNTVYVADAGNNRVVAYVNGVPTTISSGSFTFVSPQALALDSAGDLFIGDQPSATVGRVFEAMATGGVLNGTVTEVVAGGALQSVGALAVDTNPSSLTYNTLYVGDYVSAKIYTVASGGSTVTPLAVTGFPDNILPAALLKDSAGNLFVADLNSTVYEVPSGSSTASIYFIDNFQLSQPTGLALDPQGNLYILAFTSTSATPSQSIPINVIEIPGEDVSSAFRVPVTDIGNGSGIAFDSLGHLYVALYADGDVTEVVYGAPVGLGDAAVNSVGSSVVFNYEFNASIKIKSFKFTAGGDNSSEVVDEGGGCGSGNYNDGSDGGAIEPSDPYICQESFAADPTYPGIRNGAVNLLTTGSAILATTAVYSTGIAGAGVVYPLAPVAGADTTFIQPDGVAISGLDKSIYVADGSQGEVFTANGPNGKNFSVVSTAPVTLETPYGLALDGAGDLYIADFGLGEIVVVPANSAVSPYAFNPGGLLDHPLTVAFDTSGDLFIGDSGPNGGSADAGTPGYVVEVPAGGGTPFKVSTGSVTVIYPQGLATDPYTGDIYVADGGDSSQAGAGVVHIVANGGAAQKLSISGVTEPVAIVFDPAEDYYVLDQNAHTVTEVPVGGGTPVIVPFDNTLITIPSAMAVSPGSQNFTEANFATGSNGTLVYLKGNTSTTKFGSVAEGQTSAPSEVELNNIGSGILTLGDPALSRGSNSNQFPTTANNCSNSLALNPGVSCAVEFEFAPTNTGAITNTNSFSTNGYARPDGTTTTFTLDGTGKLK